MGCARSSFAPGSSGPTTSTIRRCSRTGSSRRSRNCPIGSKRTHDPAPCRGRPDRDRADPACARAPRRGLQGAVLHRRRDRVLRLEAEPAAALRRTLRREGGCREGARVGCLLHVEGDRAARAAEAGCPLERPYRRVGGQGRRRDDRALDDAFEGARGGGGGGPLRLEPLLTADETRRAEEQHPGPMDELMERAGTAVAEHVLRQFHGSVTVVCGKGNNGGDGKVCARVLREAGRDVHVVEGVGNLGTPDVIVDALLGIGLRDEPREDAARMIELMNASGCPVVAVDVPSGVNASTGEGPGAAVRATVTVTFGAVKVGLAVAPGRAHAGHVAVAPIGLRAREHEHALVPASALFEVPRKDRASTKYRAGSVLVVGGSRGLTGAPMLAALAAFRADAGYVAIAAPESTLPIIESRLLEVVKRPLPEDSRGRLLPRSADAILEAAEKASAVAIGPGLGRSDGTVELVRILLERLDLPVVLDAGALWELEPFARAAPTVLPPHTGELSRLLGTESREVDAHRLESVRRAASRFGAVVLLKGPDTLVASPREGVLVAAYGTPALATAGSGDVLTGVIACFLAKGMDPKLGAATAAVAHGVAAELVEPQRGVIASDLLPELRRALAGHGLQRAPLA